MKSWNFIAVAIATFVPLTLAYANSEDCSTADQQVSFHADSSDGGAGRRPNIQLKLNGTVLIDASYTGGAGIHLATYTFSSDETVISTVRTGGGSPYAEAYETTQSVKKLTVTQTTATLFDDYMFCKKSVYVGGPRP